MGTPGSEPEDFEAGDDQPDLDLTRYFQPGARPKPRATPPPASTEPTRTSVASETATVPQQSAVEGGVPADEETDSPAPATSRRGKRGRPRKQQPPAKQKSAESTGGRRATTFYIPVDLEPEFRQACSREGLSNGDLVITALEATADQLGGEIGKEGGRAGGSRFAARVTHQAAVKHEQMTLVNLRLFEADFDVLDELVTETGARSRNHLISTALRIYLHT